MPSECVLFNDARNTEEEAKGIRELLKRGVRGQGSGVRGGEARATILLVTSAWHMKRARMMFEKYAPEIEVVCAPADFENSMMAKGVMLPRSLLPDFNAFALNSVALHEWVGIVGYKVFR